MRLAISNFRVIFPNGKVEEDRGFTRELKVLVIPAFYFSFEGIKSSEMTSRAHAVRRPMAGEDKARESRLRKMAARQGLVLAKSRHQPPDGESAGGYMLFDSPSRAVAVFGATSGRGPLDISGKGYQGTLDEIEAYLIRGAD